jgi:hypothetical protein
MAASGQTGRSPDKPCRSSYIELCGCGSHPIKLLSRFCSRPSKQVAQFRGMITMHLRCPCCSGPPCAADATSSRLASHDTMLTFIQQIIQSMNNGKRRRTCGKLLLTFNLSLMRKSSEASVSLSLRALVPCLSLWHFLKDMFIYIRAQVF